MHLRSEIVVPLAGLWLLVSSLLWAYRTRWRGRRAVRKMLEAALRDPDPTVRRAAVFVAAQHGLAPVAQMLVDATLTERDPHVLDGIAEAIHRNQWEPTEGRTMVVLRLWAQRHVEQKEAKRQALPLREDEHV